MPNPRTLLSRADCAVALTEAGYPITSSTLATKATRGGGPPYTIFGRTALYRWEEAIAWAEAKALTNKPLQTLASILNAT